MKKLAVLAVLLVLSSGPASPDVPDQDAEFTFARVQFNMTWEALFDREAPWHHDYPYAEHLYLGLIDEYTAVRTSTEAYQIIQLDSPEIFRFPFIYVSEPGFMDLTEAEAANLREYFNRGGFAMFDDFRGLDLDRLQANMKQLFPQREMFRLDVRHPLFNSFYGIESLDMIPFYMDDRFTGGPEFWGMHDDRGRLILIANQNNDLGEYWEALDQGNMPLQSATTAVRLGVNYLVYAMTH